MKIRPISLGALTFPVLAAASGCGLEGTWRLERIAQAEAQAAVLRRLTLAQGRFTATEAVGEIQTTLTGRQRVVGDQLRLIPEAAQERRYRYSFRSNDQLHLQSLPPAARFAASYVRESRSRPVAQR